MSGYHNRFNNHGSGYAHDDAEVYCEADELYLTMNGVNQFQSPSDTGRFSAQLGNVLNQNKMPDQRAPPVSPRRNRPGNPSIPFGGQLPVQLPRVIPQSKERRHSSVTPGFHKWDRGRENLSFVDGLRLSKSIECSDCSCVYSNPMLVR